MKARISPTTAAMALTPMQKEIVRQYLESELEKQRKVWMRRMLLATCLALNDIFHFGDKRLNFALQGIEDITTDYSSRAYTPAEARKGGADVDSDAMADLMQAELSSREKIHMVITGG